ncbi:MAG: spondin domain-containing protein [Acidobacteriota bacterium]
MFKRTIFFSLLAIASLFVSASAQHKTNEGTKFTVRIENISTPDSQVAKDGTKWTFVLSPGPWVLHEREVRLFREGNPAVAGLEAEAETGNPSEIIKQLETRGHQGKHGEMLHGVFNTPVGANAPGPLVPGGVYEFTFTATPGMRLSLLTMFAQSNDWFYGPKRQGIDLFTNAKPLNGDITNEFMLFDAGTEKDEEPGVGPNQGARQKDINAGEPENGKVHAAKDSSFFTRNGELFKITITSQSAVAKM